MRNLNPLSVKGHQPPDGQAQQAPTRAEAPSAESIKGLTPQPLEPSPSVKPKGSDGSSSKRAGKSHPLMDPPVLATAALLVLTGEVMLFASVGLLCSVVVNVAAVALFFVLIRMWRRRGKGGLIDHLLKRRASGGPGGGARSGGVPGHAARRPGGLLGRLLGGRPGGGGRSAAGGNPKRGGLLGRLFGPEAGGKGRKPGKAGADKSAPGGPGGKRTGGLWPFGRSSKTKPDGKGAASKSSKAGGADTKPASKSTTKAGGKPSPKTEDGPLRRAGQDFMAGLRGEHDKDKEPKDAASDEAKPRPKHASTDKGATAPSEENTTMVQHQEDASLQRWGRNLKTISPAIEDLAKAADGTNELADAIATGVAKLAQQGESDLPAHATLTAEAAAIAAELKSIQAENPAARLRQLAARAEALGINYRQQHETDEARLAGERGSRAKEKRADVGQAEQDT